MMLKRVALTLFLALVAVYAGDWSVYLYRSAHGTATDSVQVKQFLDIKLKGQKDEFDYLGLQQVECARSLFPRSGDDPCWWVRRHAEKWTRAM